MEGILDEQLEAKEVLKPIPFIISLFIIAILICCMGVLFRIQLWPYGSFIQTLGTVAVLITGGLSWTSFKAIDDRFLKLSCLSFLFGGVAKIIAPFVAENDPIVGLLNLGERFFIIGVLATLIRYFVLRRPERTAVSIVVYPLLVVMPIWAISILFKIQSWPYVSELLTISAFVFLFGTIIMLILRLKKEIPVLRLGTVWLVLMANGIVFGGLFKVQLWPYASELISSSFFGGVLGIVFKLIQQQKLLKEQEKKEGND